VCEFFDPASNPEFKPEKDFKGRVVLLNREMALIEQTPQAFAEEHKLHLFVEDSIAVNRDLAFRVQTFEPTESFAPNKPFKTRIKWRDQAREEQSKLLVTPPETIIAELLGVKEEVAKTPAARSRRPHVADEWITAHGGLPDLNRRSTVTKTSRTPAGEICRGFSVAGEKCANMQLAIGKKYCPKYPSPVAP
jgi:hypothetical protein